MFLFSRTSVKIGRPGSIWGLHGCQGLPFLSSFALPPLDLTAGQGSGHRRFGWVGPEGASTPPLTRRWPALSPVATSLQGGGERGAQEGEGRAGLGQCHGRWADGGPSAGPGRGRSQAHVELEFKPRDPRRKSRCPSSAADSQSSGLCWDDQLCTVPSPEARGQSQPPAKLPLKDTISRALQTGAEKCSLPP